MPEFKEHKNKLGYIEAVPRPTVEELNLYYSNKYYQKPKEQYAHDYEDSEQQYFANQAKVALTTLSNKSDNCSLIDLGCGEGFFSKFFSDAGWSVTCCDFSSFGLEHHHPELLSSFMQGDINEIIDTLAQQGQTFGLINLQNVLEHVVDPVSLLENIKKILKKDSTLRIVVPNDYSDFQDALIQAGHTVKTWFSPPEHLYYFNSNNLPVLLSERGYTLYSLQADFPIEQFLVNPHSNYWKDRTLGKGAHRTRIFCQNYLIEKNIEEFINYSECAAKLGFGRDITAYFQLS